MHCSYCPDKHQQLDRTKQWAAPLFCSVQMLVLIRAVRAVHVTHLTSCVKHHRDPGSHKKLKHENQIHL